MKLTTNLYRSLLMILTLLLGFNLQACSNASGLYFTTQATDKAVLPTSNIAKIDHQVWDDILSTHVSANGFVDYNGIKDDQTKLLSYLQLLKQNAPTSHWSRAEQMAYYINLYNASAVALIIENNIPKSIKDINGPWGQVWGKKFIPVGNEMYSLNDIEKGVLQKMGDPRIHFAINCASYSCPPLLNQAFTGEKLEVQLEEVTSSFINSAANEITQEEVKLSKIFDWYSSDFTKGSSTTIDFINKYSEAQIAPTQKISYLPYNWSLNNWSR